MKKIRAFFQKKFFKTVGPIIRPFVKGIPVFGVPIVEGVNTILTPPGEPRKHSSTSQWIYVVLATVVIGVDLYFNQGANLDKLLDAFLSMIGIG